MHTLIITAHPSSHGFTHAIAARYRAEKEKNWHTVEVLNLYTTDLKMDFYSYEEKSDMKKPDATREALQAKITAADELVLVFPVWWVSVPAILKNFFDSVLTGWFAYQYVKGRMFPKMLLKWKTARIFCTCDAVGWMYWLIAHPLRITLQIGTLGWCGIWTKSFVLFDQMRKRSEDERSAMLGRVEKIAQR